MLSTIEEIENFRKHRGNTHERNHPYGDWDFDEIVLDGSQKLNEEFAVSDQYKLTLGDTDEEG